MVSAGRRHPLASILPCRPGPFPFLPFVVRGPCAVLRAGPCVRRVLACGGYFHWCAVVHRRRVPVRTGQVLPPVPQHRAARICGVRALPVLPSAPCRPVHAVAHGPGQVLPPVPPRRAARICGVRALPALPSAPYRPVRAVAHGPGRVHLPLPGAFPVRRVCGLRPLRAWRGVGPWGRWNGCFCS